MGKLIGASSAAEILGRSVQYVRFLGESGKLPTVRRRPTMRFRLDDVLAARGKFPKDPGERRGRPRLMEEALHV